MQHNHRMAIHSPEADMIERNIETHLKRLSALIDELQYRIKHRIRPQKLLSQRWVWLVIVTVYLIMKIPPFFGRQMKAVRSIRARKKLSECVQQYAESIADQKR